MRERLRSANNERPPEKTSRSLELMTTRSEISMLHRNDDKGHSVQTELGCFGANKIAQCFSDASSM